MDGIDEHHRLVDLHRVEQVLVIVNESLLFGVVEAPRHGFRLAIVKAQAMQQDNQPGAAVALPKRPRQPRPDQPRAAGQFGADPIAEGGFLLAAQAAAGAFVAEPPQPLDPASLISATPVANCVVVQQQSRPDPLATPRLIEKDHRVGSAGDAVLRKPVPRNADQGSPILTRKKSAANHLASRIPLNRPVKPFLGFSRSQGIYQSSGSLNFWALEDSQVIR